MKPAAKKSISKPPAKKAPKRWRKRVFALFDSWTREDKKLTLIYGPRNCQLQQAGSLVKVRETTYCFINQSGLRVFLCPDHWKSLHFEETLGTVLVIDEDGVDGGFMLRESMSKGPEPIEIPNEVKTQLARWAEQGRILLGLFRRGCRTTVGTFRANHSKGRFILVNEKTLEVHVIDLARCLRIELPEEEGSCSIHLWDKHQMIEIVEVHGTPEEALASFTSPSERVH